MTLLNAIIIIFAVVEACWALDTFVISYGFILYDILTCAHSFSIMHWLTFDGGNKSNNGDIIHFVLKFRLHGNASQSILID